MKVSTKVQYGMLALADIALYSESGSAVSGPEIAERQDISQKYLEQILTHLKQAGLIRAQKGLRGGYTLARAADQIKLSEIFNALDSSILEETDPAGEKGGESLRGAVNDCVWRELNHSVSAFAESRTLSDIMQKCRELSGDWDMYVI
uniref:BadM/Rrf2 family transcriptional regulator n=1 Tax=uncultured bacterium Contig46 TaxID=1393580 RepID=W0FMX5_9BACT|nr:BadM/Rrf2 family transcriptional regulator [uncultured bacterium Contig46]